MGDTGAIRELVTSRTGLNQRMDRTNRRCTPMHLAVVKKQANALVTLIELGGDLNLEDAVGLTPLDQAALDGEEELARLLMAALPRITPACVPAVSVGETAGSSFVFASVLSALARPKSSTLTAPSDVSLILAGFKSR